jgi:hypothetical protein
LQVSSLNWYSKVDEVDVAVASAFLLPPPSACAAAGENAPFMNESYSPKKINAISSMV